MVEAEETGTHGSHRMVQGTMGLRMLGLRQVTPRWENDTVWQKDGANGRWARGGCAPPPRTENRRRAEKGGEGWRRAEKGGAGEEE